MNQELFDPVLTVISDGLAVDITTQVTKAGVITTTAFATATRHTITPAAVRSVQGAVLAPIDLPANDYTITSDTRVIPDGGAALYRIGGQVHALNVEVLDFTSKP